MLAKPVNCTHPTPSPQARLDEEQIDYDLLEDLITHIDESGGEFGEGAVLVFLPGIAEIQSLLDRLSASRRFGTPEKSQVGNRWRHRESLGIQLPSF